MDTSGIPPILLKYDGICTPLKSKQKQFKSRDKSRRYSEIHAAIARVIVVLLKENKIFPSASEVWGELKKMQDQIQCIQEISDTEIYWCSFRGVSQTMKRDTSNNVVSAFKTGKKSLNEFI